jgi:hypothetical protein
MNVLGYIGLSILCIWGVQIFMMFIFYLASLIERK